MIICSKTWTFFQIGKIRPDRIFNPEKEDMSGKNRTYGKHTKYSHIAENHDCKANFLPINLSKNLFRGSVSQGVCSLPLTAR